MCWMPETSRWCKIDRGGQVTYHGPGQLLVYPLIDMRRAAPWACAIWSPHWNVPSLTLAGRYGIKATCRERAPGVYVDDRKLASVGLRIRRGGSYHGLALNVDMDLEPFQRINPCGYAGLQMTQLAALGGPGDVPQVAQEFAELFRRRVMHAGGLQPRTPGCA